MKKREYLNEDERYYFSEGTWTRAFDRFGAHPFCDANKGEGYRFSLWAPGVSNVFLIGSFNDWNETSHPMKQDTAKDIWTLFVPGITEGVIYKYLIIDRNGEKHYKADPYGYYSEVPPATASRVFDIEGYDWKDGRWMYRRSRSDHRSRPMNIYEVHLGSWKRHEDGGYYTYDELSEELVDYVADMGYTHVELMPVMGHPFEGSWGYQITCYYAPTSRYGDPKQFMHFVDRCHSKGIGVILDWVCGHFCKDEQGLRRFNGQKLYELEDHLQWGTCKFDFGRGEVRSFLLSNAVYWIEKYHIDGIRVDGVTSMLYLNFGVGEKEKKRYNVKGTEENLEATAFIKNLNKTIGIKYPDIMMIAEESTAWPLVTYPPESGGLGFNYKWDMGWMNDTLHYMKTDFPFRQGTHNLLTFSMMYAFNENYVLALSHDEVVHGKCSLIRRMPGDYWKQFAGLRLLMLYQICHPGAKLTFMGDEIAEFIEWRYYESLEWFLPRDFESHRKHQIYIKALNRFYTDQKALWQRNYSWEGFEWLDADNNIQSILTFIRKGDAPKDNLIVALNFGTEAYEEYRIGVPARGTYTEVFGSDEEQFGGSGVNNRTFIKSENVPWHGKKYSIVVKMPPIGGTVLRKVTKKEMEV